MASLHSQPIYTTFIFSALPQNFFSNQISLFSWIGCSTALFVSIHDCHKTLHKTAVMHRAYPKAADNPVHRTYLSVYYSNSHVYNSISM